MQAWERCRTPHNGQPCSEAGIPYGMGRTYMHIYISLGESCKRSTRGVAEGRNLGAKTVIGRGAHSVVRAAREHPRGRAKP